MAEELESGASLLARREYARAVPLLKKEHEKYPSNPRIRLQYADALAGASMFEDAIAQYEATAKYYEDNGLTVQAIAVRKKAEKASEQLASKKPEPAAAGITEPLFTRPVPKSPLFEILNETEREAIVKEMEIETHDEGSVIINEGDPGSSMYVIASGEVKVYTRTSNKSGTVYLARLGEGDFFGEVSVLTGKPRTATITASQRTELLRLDKAKLDGVLSKYPGIRKVLDDFYKKRAKHTVEAMIESQRGRLEAGQVAGDGGESRVDARTTSTTDDPELLQELRAHSADMRIERFGRTRQGRELLYAIFARPAVTQPEEALISGKPIIVLAANVHGGERTHRESTLIVAREFATPGTELNAMLDEVEKTGYRIPTPREQALDILIEAIQPKKSHTFRSGKTGGWREFFTEEHKKLFKDVAGDLLVRLGYEKNNDW